MTLREIIDPIDRDVKIPIWYVILLTLIALVIVVVTFFAIPDLGNGVRLVSGEPVLLGDADPLAVHWVEIEEKAYLILFLESLDDGNFSVQLKARWFKDGSAEYGWTTEMVVDALLDELVVLLYRYPNAFGDGGGKEPPEYNKITGIGLNFSTYINGEVSLWHIIPAGKLPYEDVIASLEARVEELEDEKQYLETVVERLEGDLEDERNKTLNVQRTLMDLEDEIKSLNTQITRLDTDMGAVKSTVDVTASDVAKVADRVSDLDGETSQAFATLNSNSQQLREQGRYLRENNAMTLWLLIGVMFSIGVNVFLVITFLLAGRRRRGIEGS